MPKANPKHNQIHLARTTPKGLNPSNLIYQKKMGSIGAQVKFHPKLPSNGDLKRIQRKNQSLLFQIEHAITTWMKNQTYVDDFHILNATGCILQNVPISEKKVQFQDLDPNSTSLLNQIELELFKNLLILIDSFQNSEEEYSPNQIKNSIACIYDSVRFWTKKNGPTGYLDFIAQYVPAGLSHDDLEELDNQFHSEDFNNEERENSDDEGEIEGAEFKDGDSMNLNYIKEIVQDYTGSQKNTPKLKIIGKKQCGLCGKTHKLTKTECCNQWICDDADQYQMFSFTTNSCYRNHDRYTLCASHYHEEHPGDWKTCPKCQENIETEMYVWYGTNEYNFEKLPNPPKYNPTHCAKCKKIINLGNDNYTHQGTKYYCTKCHGFNCL